MTSRSKSALAFHPVSKFLNGPRISHTCRAKAFASSQSNFGLRPGFRPLRFGVFLSSRAFRLQAIELGGVIPLDSSHRAKASDQLRLCIRDRAQHPVHHRCRQPASQAHRRASGLPVQGSCPHASPRLRLCTGERRPRHAGNSRLARSSRHPAHGSLYRIEPRAIQRFLAHLIC